MGGDQDEGDGGEAGHGANNTPVPWLDLTIFIQICSLLRWRFS